MTSHGNIVAKGLVAVS